MSIITVNNSTFTGLKSVYLNNVLKLRDHNGKTFTRILRPSTVRTSCNHILWFTEVNGTWNHFYKEDGVWHLRENNLHGKWKDPTDNAAEKFAKGEIALRSVICRWVNNNDNRFYGEFQLIEINDEYRIWKRVADSVEMETVA